MAISTSQSVALTLKLWEIKRDIRNAKSIEVLNETLVHLSDILTSVLHRKFLIRESIAVLLQELSQANSEQGPDEFREQSLDLVNKAELVIALSQEEESGKIEAQDGLESPEFPNLDQQIWAIITNRYFRSWPFYIVVAILVAGISAWGFNVTNSFKELSNAQIKLDNAKLVLQQAEAEAQKAEKAIQNAKADIAEQQKRFKGATELAIQDLTAEFRDSIRTEVGEFKKEIGDPEQIRGEVEADFLLEIRNRSMQRLGGLLGSLKDQVEVVQDQAVSSLATERGVSPATLKGLVMHQLEEIAGIDEEVHKLILFQLGNNLDEPVESIQDFANRRAANVSTDFDEEILEAKNIAFEHISEELGSNITGFEDLTKLKIGEIHDTGQSAIKRLEGARDDYLLEIDEKVGEIPAKIEGLETRLTSAEGLVTRLIEDAAAKTDGMDALVQMREPLVRFASYLDDPFLRKQINIANVLGNAKWLVLASLALSILGVLLAVIAVRCWLSERKSEN